MDIFVCAFLGGLLGAALMDITETFAAKRGISSGVNVALIGRWFLHLCRGQIRHRDILTSQSLTNEVKAGWVFHFLVGGAGVALMYPLMFRVTGWQMPENHLLGGMVFGLMTSLLPWFVLLPSFGWGLFGRKSPHNGNALLASTISHIPYGLGVGAVMSLAF